MPRIIKQKIEFEGRIEEREVVIEGDDLPVWSAAEVFKVVGTPVPRVDGADPASAGPRATPPISILGTALRRDAAEPARRRPHHALRCVEGRGRAGVRPCCPRRTRRNCRGSTGRAGCSTRSCVTLG